MTAEMDRGAPLAPEWFNPVAQDFMADPSRAVARARREVGDIFYSPKMSAFVVTDFAEVNRVLGDYETFSSAARVRNGQRVPERFAGKVPQGGYLHLLLLMTDPPDHTETRRMLSPRFRRSRMLELEDPIRAAAHQLIDSFESRGSCELMHEYAYALTYRTLTMLLDIPLGEAGRLEQLARDFVMMLHDSVVPLSEGVQVAIWERWLDTREYLEQLVQERRQSDGDDAISMYARALGTGAAPTMDKVVTDLCGLISAGADTTALTIAHGAALLAAGPEQLVRLAEEPDGWENAVEEVMRRHGSLAAVVRVPTVDVEIHGVPIPAGSSIVCYLSGGSVDEKVFPEPMKVDISRPNARDHMAFGRGMHMCIGAPLGRLQSRIGLQTLFDRLPGAHPVPDQAVEYEGSIGVAALKRFEFEW
jgi:cytochrome P450